ncbi:cadmium-inducible lysosomal protein CDR-5, putative [Brugia malayi]|uniref:Cadmium-inducible lysosomal protein CDR-5, putative n=2 Tax=Brugia malayi TaxID=6279 RepID=A0A4E9F9R5_BRUMA|nr:cadmium-inducible lysosomal protein CDR-5, putative [Brugia malayi]VIO92865.1 cadmium-inducible lysosomal protein CDR-5, putative [Brugia malayi]
MQMVSNSLRQAATLTRINAAVVSNNVTAVSRGNPTILSQFPIKKSTSKIYNKKWKKDIVYLYQFNRASSSPNISPFCFKLETWLRANELKHELRSYWNFQPWERYFPFIELNGEKFSDSQLIMERLQKHFNLNDELMDADIGVARAIDQMIERNTHYLLLYFIFVENLSKFVQGMEPSLIKRWFMRGTIYPFLGKVHRIFVDVGFSKCSRNDLISMLQKDIAAIDVILGDKKFLFGVKPTTSDFTVFGHLATSYYLPFRQPVTDILDNKYPRVKRLIERMRQHYYPEWEFNT